MPLIDSRELKDMVSSSVFRPLFLRVTVVFLTVVLAAALFYGILHYFSVVFFLFSWGYVFLALTLTTIRLFAGRKSLTLIDYEREKEE